MRTLATLVATFWLIACLGASLQGIYESVYELSPGAALPWRAVVSAIVIALLGLVPAAATTLIIARKVAQENELHAAAAAQAGVARNSSKAFFWRRSGIALNLVDRTITLLQNDQIKTYPLSDIRRCRIWYESVATKEDRSATGLFVLMRDASHPEWKIDIFKVAEQERWRDMLEIEIATEAEVRRAAETAEAV